MKLDTHSVIITTKLYGYFKSRRTDGWKFAKLWEVHGWRNYPTTGGIRFLAANNRNDGYYVGTICALDDVIRKQDLIPATKQDRAKALLLGFK